MRSFQTIVALLFALVAFVFAEGTQSYDATVYVTSTIYRVNTVTMSGSSYSVANSTTTIAGPTGPVIPTSTSYAPGNSSAIYPTGSGAPSPSAFPGAASGLSVNGALVAVLAAGLGFFAL